MVWKILISRKQKLGKIAISIMKRHDHRLLKLHFALWDAICYRSQMRNRIRKARATLFVRKRQIIRMHTVLQTWKRAYRDRLRAHCKDTRARNYASINTKRRLFERWRSISNMAKIAENFKVSLARAQKFRLKQLSLEVFRRWLASIRIKRVLLHKTVVALSHWRVRLLRSSMRAWNEYVCLPGVQSVSFVPDDTATEVRKLEDALSRTPGNRPKPRPVKNVSELSSNYSSVSISPKQIRFPKEHRTENLAKPLPALFIPSAESSHSGASQDYSGLEDESTEILEKLRQMEESLHRQRPKPRPLADI